MPTAAALTTIAHALNTAPKGTRVKLVGYKTTSGRVCDYELVLGTYGELERDALRQAHRLHSATVAAATGVSKGIAMTALNDFRSALRGRVNRLEVRGEQPAVVGGMVFGQVVRRSAPSTPRVAKSAGARVKRYLERAARLDTFRSFKLESAESIEIEGQEICWECGLAWDGHGNNGVCPTEAVFDPYAYGFAKVSALEGEGSW